MSGARGHGFTRKSFGIVPLSDVHDRRAESQVCPKRGRQALIRDLEDQRTVSAGVRPAASDHKEACRNACGCTGSFFITIFVGPHPGDRMLVSQNR